MVEMNASSELKRAGNSVETAVSSQKDLLPRLDARRLFAASREVIIEHEGADYRLRLTANGKLILTK
jgi:hemin uptake protein HemP